jgi:hypothetical protein
MGEPRNRHVPLSLSRRLACDAMHFSQKVPLVVAERRLPLAGLVAARALAELEQVLLGEVLAELRSGAAPRQAA